MACVTVTVTFPRMEAPSVSCATPLALVFAFCPFAATFAPATGSPASVTLTVIVCATTTFFLFLTALTETLAAAWDAAVAALPPDWSDLYAEVELESSDYLDRAALLLAPVNPARDGRRLAFRFRAARRFGYGVSPEMAQRCLERLDAEGTRGTVRVLRALSDTRPVQTQGPVWHVGGKSV